MEAWTKEKRPTGCHFVTSTVQREMKIIQVIMFYRELNLIAIISDSDLLLLFMRAASRQAEIKFLEFFINFYPFSAFCMKIDYNLDIANFGIIYHSPL